MSLLQFTAGQWCKVYVRNFKSMRAGGPGQKTDLGSKVRQARRWEHMVQVFVPVVLVGAVKEEAKAAHARRPHWVKTLARPGQLLHMPTIC